MSFCNHVAITRFLKSQIPRVVNRDRGILLDIGCGVQPYRSIYADSFKKVIAADFDVRSRIDVRIDVHALPLRDESCSVVLLTEVIEHLAEVKIALVEVCRVLRTDGYLFLTWPFLYPLHELPHDFARYTEFGMQHLLEGTGLRIEALYRRGDMLCVVFGILEQFVFGLVEFLSRLPVISHLGSRLLKPLLRRFFIAAWSLYFTLIRNAERFQPIIAGANLKGPANHLALWTMGYCARVRKVKESLP